MNRPDVRAAAFVAESAEIYGDVKAGKGSSIWYNATVRTEMQPVRIGERTNVQDNAVIHTSPKYDTIIGNGVTIGHSAVVHGCHVGDNVLIGIGAIVMDGAVIGEDCIIGAGTLIPPGKKIEPRSVMVGNPCKKLRDATEEDMAYIRRNAAEYEEVSAMHRKGLQ
ncbi:MAG: gamma carbonic anhydrase family protein [Lachnospiraceae bacterium]|nr:gamma carbonic anhydrase family protein [Lachnospiraceae bacterium]